MRKLVSLAVLALGFFAAQAQNASIKVGFADVAYIFEKLPDYKQIDQELRTTQNKLKEQIEGKAQEFQKKLADYQQNAGTMLDAVRVNTERELQQLQQNLEKLQQDAQVTIQNKEQQLMGPVQEKIGKAIEAVATENGFTYILSSQIAGQDVVLFGDEKLNVSDLVLKKLGVTVPPKTEAKTTPQNNPK